MYKFARLGLCKFCAHCCFVGHEVGSGSFVGDCSARDQLLVELGESSSADTGETRVRGSNADTGHFEACQKISRCGEL